MSSRRLTLLALACALTLTAPAVAATGSADGRLSEPRLEPATAAATDDAGIRLAPVRFDPQVAEPGTELRYELRVTNSTEGTVRIAMDTLPLEGSDDPDVFAQPAANTAPSARAVAWVDYPGFGRARALPSGSTLRIPVRVRVPGDASPGTYALGLAVTETVTAPGVSTEESARVQLGLAPATAIVVRVPGAAAGEVRLGNVRSPRVLWGGRSGEFRVEVENVGDTDLTVDGEVRLDSFLSSARRTLDAQGPEKGFPTLPGGRRELVMRWTDPPLLGWFQPELVVVGGKGSGVRATDNLPTVFVLPPWWLVALLVLALWLPLRARRRRRRDEAYHAARRERARARVEERLRRDEARRRAAAARGRR